ncbi:MAG: ATP-binding protein [Victivallales bacterium]|nr:ATP-binding protein [Victivallales bacterium]
MTTHIPSDWRSIIYRAVESEELDYKAAQNWSELSRAGKAKFVRHCMALANTKGGYIVVGVGEDASGRPCVYTGLTEKQSRSFDPTAVGNFINNYADPEIDFSLERPLVDGRQYAVFVVRRFNSLPHVCSYGCETELQQGVLYIRSAEASSRPAFRSQEIHALIQRSLRNQREQLGRMLRGILYENSSLAAPDAKARFREQRNLSRHMLTSRREVVDGNRISFEFSVFPAEFAAKKFTLTEIRAALEQAVYLFPSPRFMRQSEVAESYSTNVSVRSLPQGATRIWQAFRSGFFHLLEYAPAGERSVAYRSLQDKIAEAVFFAGEFYSDLGYNDEMFALDIRLNGVEDALLTGIKPRVRRSGSPAEYRCHIPEIVVTMQRTMADLISGPEDHAARIVRDLCERFNVPSSRHEGLEEAVRAYLEERMPEAFFSDGSGKKV